MKDSLQNSYKILPFVVTAVLVSFLGFLPGLVGVIIGAGKIRSFSVTQTPKPP